MAFLNVAGEDFFPAGDWDRGMHIYEASRENLKAEFSRFKQPPLT